MEEALVAAATDLSKLPLLEAALARARIENADVLGDLDLAVASLRLHELQQAKARQDAAAVALQAATSTTRYDDTRVLEAAIARARADGAAAAAVGAAEAQLDVLRGRARLAQALDERAQTLRAEGAAEFEALLAEVRPHVHVGSSLDSQASA